MRVTPPRAALVLGYAGLLPLLGAVVVELLLNRSADHAPLAFIIAMPALLYAGLILSFLGGTWWGAAVGRVPDGELWRWLGLAVLPSLWAAGAFCSGWLGVSPAGIAVILAVGLVLSLLVDRAALARGLVPVWWLQLRIPLSLGLAVETLAVGLLA